MSTIKEVSRLAGVSISTVSRVLNDTVPVADETKRRVLNAVQKLDYQPNAFARGLVTNRSGGVGVTVNDLSSPYFGTLLKGVEEVIEEAGMHLIVASGHAKAETERRAVEFLKQRRTDALIIHSEELPDADLLNWAKGDIPILVIGRYIAELAKSCVYLDNETGGRLATRHLLEKGHRRIAHITGPLSIHDSRERLVGYRRALEEAGLNYEEDFVVEADFMEAGGQIATKRLLERKLDFSAIFVANDQMAVGVLQTLREAGLRVPEDISLVGFDDVLLARYLYPALTTIRQPLFEMGQAAAKLALAALDGKEMGVRRKFEPELIVRKSVTSIR